MLSDPSAMLSLKSPVVKEKVRSVPLTRFRGLRLPVHRAVTDEHMSTLPSPPRVASEVAVVPAQGDSGSFSLRTPNACEDVPQRRAALSRRPRTGTGGRPPGHVRDASALPNYPPEMFNSRLGSGWTSRVVNFWRIAKKLQELKRSPFLYEPDRQSAHDVFRQRKIGHTREPLQQHWYCRLVFHAPSSELAYTFD